jgi:hypothetical protein
MKRKELYDYIRTEIINELSLEEGTAEENAAKAAELKSIDAQMKALAAKKAEVTKTGTIAELDLDEMARTPNKVKLGDPAKVALVKKLYGGTWKGDMLDVVEKAGEEGISQLELAMAVGKKSQPAINPAVSEFLKIGAFALTKTAGAEPEAEPTVVAPSAEEEEWMAAADADEKDDWEKAEDEDEDTDKGPSAADIKAAEKSAAKVTGGKGYAKQLSPEDEEKYTRLRTGIETKVAKILALPKAKRSSSTDLQVLKVLIKRDDVKKLFKSKGVNLADLVADAMN